MKIPESVIETIKDRVDIVAVVGRYVALKRAGRNFVGLCPFHNEKSPSFNVSQERHSYHCFGCGEGGDVFKFLGKLQGRNFPEVLRELAKDVGVEIPDVEESPAEREADRQKSRLYAMNDRVLHWYLDQLHGPQGAPARNYLEGRSLDAAAASTFELGFGGAGRDGLWTDLGKSEEERQDLLASGVCVAGERGPYDRFFGRVIFPIRDERQRVIGFGGRVFGDRAKKDGVAKYLNSPESPVYDKSSVFYRWPQALQKARKGAPLVIVEGYFDAIALEQCGLAAIASCGTALTTRHATLLQRSGSQVVLCWDGDAAGERAIQKAAVVLLPLKVDTRLASLPVGDDPDTYVARVGAQSAQRLVDESESLPLYVISQAARALEDAGDDVPRKAAAIRSLAWLFQAIPEGLERGMYLEQAAKRLDVDAATLTAELKAGPKAPSNPDPAPSTPQAPARFQRPAKPVGTPRLRNAEVDVVRLVAEQPHRAAALEEGRVCEDMPDAVRQLVAFARDLVHAHGPFSPGSPHFAALQESVGQAEIKMILQTVSKGMRVFEDVAMADKAQADMLTQALRTRLERQERDVRVEMDAAEKAGDQERVRQLHEHIKSLRQQNNSRRTPRRSADRNTPLH